VQSHTSSEDKDGRHENRFRSLEDLEMTVNYLISQIYVHQRSCAEMNMKHPLSLVNAVNFVDDRIRAVQVDLTTLLGMRSDDTCSDDDMNDGDVSPWRTVRKIQAQLIRYNLLTQHLLSNCNDHPNPDGTSTSTGTPSPSPLPSQQKYQWKFAHTALTTAISSFFASLDSERAEGLRRNDEVNDGDEEDDEEIDEIMSYAALLHLVTIIKARELAVPESSETFTSSSSGSGVRRCGLKLDGGEGISAILGLYRKYIPSTLNVNVYIRNVMKVEEKKESLSGSSSSSSSLLLSIHHSITQVSVGTSPSIVSGSGRFSDGITDDYAD